MEFAISNHIYNFYKSLSFFLNCIRIQTGVSSFCVNWNWSKYSGDFTQLSIVTIRMVAVVWQLSQFLTSRWTPSCVTIVTIYYIEVDQHQENPFSPKSTRRLNQEVWNLEPFYGSLVFLLPLIYELGQWIFGVQNTNTSIAFWINIDYPKYVFVTEQLFLRYTNTSILSSLINQLITNKNTNTNTNTETNTNTNTETNTKTPQLSRRSSATRVSSPSPADVTVTQKQQSCRSRHRFPEPSGSHVWRRPTPTCLSILSLSSLSLSTVVAYCPKKKPWGTAQPALSWAARAGPDCGGSAAALVLGLTESEASILPPTPHHWADLRGRAMPLHCVQSGHWAGFASRWVSIIWPCSKI